VLVRHALPNSIGPLLAVATLDASAVIGVSLAADAGFGVGGLASLLVYVLGRADPFALTAILVVLSVVVVAFMLLGDLLTALMDPRMRRG
jgi:peptide/nickel transport system permease protein